MRYGFLALILALSLIACAETKLPEGIQHACPADTKLAVIPNSGVWGGFEGHKNTTKAMCVSDTEGVVGNEAVYDSDSLMKLYEATRLRGHVEIHYYAENLFTHKWDNRWLCEGKLVPEVSNQGYTYIFDFPCHKKS